MAEAVSCALSGNEGYAPDMRTDRIREIERNSKAKRAREFRALGLTTRGTVYLRARLTSEERRIRKLDACHTRARERFALGLNSRGNKRVYMIVLSAVDAAILEADINAMVGGINNVYDALPDHIKPRVLNLAHSLSSLRKQIAIVEKHP